MNKIFLRINYMKILIDKKFLIKCNDICNLLKMKI